MDLWIRTQDRERLIKPKCIVLISSPRCYSICEDHESNDKWVLGNYKSKKRALEVLDEIQNVILGILTLEEIEEQKTKKYTGIGKLSMKSNNIVFEMPKE